MIQRVQSLYFLLTIIFSVLFLQGDLIDFTAVGRGVMMIDLSGINKVSETGEAVLVGNSLILSVLLFLIPVLSFIAIFLFKKRKLQLRIAVAVIFLCAILILAFAFYCYQVSTGFNAEIVPRIKLIYPFLILICAYLAYRGIKKDDEIVKSYDRLR